LIILPIKQASALTFAPSKMAIATKVIRGIGERLGINWTSEALSTVVGYLAAQSDTAGHEPILPFWWLFGTTPDTIPIDADTSQVLLTPDDFKDGTKAIKEAIDVIVPGTVLPIIGKCAESFLDENSEPILATNYIRYTRTDGGQGLVTFTNPSGHLVPGVSDYIATDFGTTNIYSQLVAAPLRYKLSLTTTNSSFAIFDLSVSYYFGNDFRDCNYTTTNNDITNISNVTNNMWNTTTNNYNYYNNYPVTIINNGTGTENVDVPVNPPMTPEETGNISDPPVPDNDNDGIPDSTDITPGGETPVPDDTGIFAKLFPVLLIVKLFGVLGSCLMYLVRMFQFIMTIPGIDAIPIDNDAFVWFRSAQIVGIKIYDVVSSLAGVGLSFIVFRAIRRAYL
jgi:hypothetical protein